jgi:hypothetical protein
LDLPLAPNRPRTVAHDYARHGTVTLFAALIVLTGRLITGRCPYACRMAALPQADRPRTPKHLDLHFDRGTTTRAEVAYGAVRFGHGRVHTKLGVRVLWWQPLGDTVFYSKGRDVADPERLKGQKVAVPSKSLKGLITRCGGVPTSLSVRKFRHAIEDGTLDMAVASFAAFQSLGLSTRVRTRRVVEQCWSNAFPLS